MKLNFSRDFKSQIVEQSSAMHTFANVLKLKFFRERHKNFEFKVARKEDWCFSAISRIFRTWGQQQKKLTFLMLDINTVSMPNDIEEFEKSTFFR